MTCIARKKCQSCKLRYESSWCGINFIVNILRGERFRKGDEEQNCHDCRLVTK